MDGILAFLAAIFFFPATLAPWAFLTAICFGVLFLSIAGEGLGFLLMIGLLWLIVGGGALAATLMTGLGILFWVFFASVLFYNAEKWASNNKYDRFTYNMLVVMAIAFMVFLNTFQMSLSSSIVALLLFTTVYLVVGIPFARYKWRKYAKYQLSWVLRNWADRVTDDHRGVTRS